jgi:hypothetical protein
MQEISVNQLEAKAAWAINSINKFIKRMLKARKIVTFSYRRKPIKAKVMLLTKRSYNLRKIELSKLQQLTKEPGAF